MTKREKQQEQLKNNVFLTTLNYIYNWGRLRSLSHDDEVMSVIFVPDGTLLVSGGYDQVVYLWGIPH